MDNKKLFVGNLPYTIGETELEEAFGQSGQVVSAFIPKDRETGRSRGFGFVEMTDTESAEKAIESLNQSELGGRKIVVNIARERQQR